MGSKFKFLKLEYLPSNQCFFTVTITLLSGQKNKDKGMISHRIYTEANVNFLAKYDSKDQKLAMFPYKMDTLYDLKSDWMAGQKLKPQYLRHRHVGNYSCSAEANSKSRKQINFVRRQITVRHDYEVLFLHSKTCWMK